MQDGDLSVPAADGDGARAEWMIFCARARALVKRANHIHHSRGLIVVKVQGATGGARDKQFAVGRKGHSDLVPAHFVTSVALGVDMG